jgi:hypothetical protein
MSLDTASIDNVSIYLYICLETFYSLSRQSNQHISSSLLEQCYTLAENVSIIYNFFNLLSPYVSKI